MREILFDENGERIERSWSENQASQFSVPERVFQAYAVRHLGLSAAGVEVNRKMLADIAVNDREDFRRFVEIAREGAAA